MSLLNYWLMRLRKGHLGNLNHSNGVWPRHRAEVLLVLKRVPE
jgi:hypothetical protein